jgi:GNAT superfamily N-acetyltransferase
MRYLKHINENETPIDEVKIVEELRNFKGSEYFLTAYATIKGIYVGHCDYTLYKEDISINYLQVNKEFRKKGIATQLMDFVKKEYTGKLIDYGYSTDDGAKFLDSYMLNKKKKLLKIGELLHDKGYKLMKERDIELSIEENLEKDIAIITFNNKSIEFTKDDCLNLANKYNMFYNQKENAFVVKIKSLNNLKELIRNSEDLEIEDPEYHIFTDDSRYNADFEMIVKDIDKDNKKKIKYLYNIDLYEDDQLHVELITKILKAANDAYNDHINTAIQSVVFDKLYKTKYFKQYSNGVNYKIEHGFYILLATPKFLEESVEHKLEYIVRNGGNDFATATIFNIFNDVNNQIILQEKDFDIKLEKEFFNQCLEKELKEKGK